MANEHDIAPEDVSSEHPSSCLLCGQIAPTFLYGHWICEHCKHVVQAEALSKKRKALKEGSGPTTAD